MKKTGIICVCAALSMGLLASCASQNPSAQIEDSGQITAFMSSSDFSAVLSTTWELIEVKTVSGATVIDRQNLPTLSTLTSLDGSVEEQKVPNLYTLTFLDGRVSGKAAPNNYSGPYTLGDSHNITFGGMLSTRMALLEEPKGLKEGEYFLYLAKVKTWEISGGQLYLYTEDDVGGEAALVFNAVSE